MEVSQSTSSNSPPPFLTKTYEMVDDRITDSIVSWGHSGHSFVVWNPPEFARDLLPKYFKHNNFSSFVRQLNTYGFRKIDPDQWEFANEEFIRGQRHLLKNIHRRKPIHSHSAQNQGSTAPLTESEKQEFEAEIERLKHDKGALLLELQKYKKEKEVFVFQIQSLGERLFNMEHRQRQMMNFLAQVLQKPGFASSLMTQSEMHSKKRRLLMPNHVLNEAGVVEDQIMTFQKEKPDAISVPLMNVEMIERLESSLTFWENFLYGIGQVSADVMDDMVAFSHPSPLIITEMHSSSGDPDTNTRPCSPNSYPSSPPSRDVHSSPELGGTINHADSPAISSIYLNLDSCPKSLGIDVNSEPANASEVEASKEWAEEMTNPATPAGANDVFWAQFLTETPGSSDAQEVQSEIRDMDDRKSDSQPTDHRRHWWSRNNVDNLTKKMGHLTSAERT